MSRARSHRRRSGFTAVEMLIVVALLGILATIGMPLLMRVVHRAKMEALVQRTFVLIQIARSESISKNVNTIVRVDPEAGAVTAFADIDGPNAGDPPDFMFNPVDGEPRHTTDYEIARYPLPVGIEFSAPDGEDQIDGFTEVPGGDDEQVAVFAPDGSIDQVGAFRLGDQRGNFLEIRVTPQATARVQVRKWTESDDGWGWYQRGEDQTVWNWS